MKKIPDKKADLPKESMQAIISLGRGLSFANSLPASADAHYAGKGIKLNQPDTPIFWYRPEGSQKFRILDADLSIKESDSAPNIKNALRLSKKLNDTKKN